MSTTPHTAIQNTDVLADLTVAAAAYESAWREGYPITRPRSEEGRKARESLAPLYRDVLAAHERLEAEVGPDLAKQLRVALVFAAANTHGTRKPEPTDVRHAIRRAWEYV